MAASAPEPPSDTPSDIAPAIPGSSAPAPSSSAASATATVGTAKRRYVLGAIGDSLTDERSQGGGYLAVLRERCPKSTFLGFGKGGNMTNMMRKRFLRDVYGEGLAEVRPKYTHVLILGGLGDILSDQTAFRTAKKIGEDIGLMATWARERGAKVIVLKLPPWGGMNAYNGARGAMTRAVNDWIDAEVAAQRIDATFDTRAVLACGNVELLCDRMSWADGIHWSKAGQRAVGEALHAALFADCE